jgi:PncC family amidohydrolase
MDELLELGAQAGALLVERHQTIAVAESSAAGLISAALLAVPGASAYFLGGAVVYTRASRTGLLQIPESALEGIRASTEEYALLLARSARQRLASDWAIGETGASGPTGNRYGDAPGHVCVGVSGASEAARTLETGHGNRLENMYLFGAAALQLFLELARK